MRRKDRPPVVHMRLADVVIRPAQAYSMTRVGCSCGWSASSVLYTNGVWKKHAKKVGLR